MLDLAWAHMVRPPGGMTNAFELREIMKASVGYDPRSVDEVLAEHKRRHDEPAPRPGIKGRPAPPTVSAAAPKKSEMDKLAALLANAKPRPAPPTS